MNHNIMESRPGILSKASFLQRDWAPRVAADLVEGHFNSVGAIGFLV